MPLPNEAHVDAALSTFATAYANKNFFADRLSPIVGVDKRSGKFFTRTRRDVSKVVNDRIGPRSSANELSYTLGTANYSVDDRALKDIVPSTLMFNADDPLSPEEIATETLMQGLMLARERRVATVYTTTGNYLAANVITPTAAWSSSTATPLLDINSAIAAIPGSGAECFTYAWCSLPVFNNLRKIPEILALKGTDKGQVGRAELAQFFEIDEVFVSDTFYDTANEGQTASYGRVWSTSMFGVVKVPKSTTGASISAFTATFRTKDGIQVRKWDDPATGKGGSTWVQPEFSDDDDIVIQSDMAAVINGV